MKNWIKNKYWSWLEAQDHNRFGVLALWATVSEWWALRPMVTRCPGCEAKIWHNGGAPAGGEYCDQYCFYYGPTVEEEYDSEKIPF